MLTTLGLLALAGAGANALMIPSTVSVEQSGGRLIDPYSQLLQVPCLGCMYAQPHDGDFIWTKGVENVLLVNVSVGASPSTLEINGAQFYPRRLEDGSIPPPIYVSQVPASVSLADIKANPAQYTNKPLLVTDFRYFFGPAQSVDNKGHELLTLTLHFRSLEQQEINVPDLTITVLKDAEHNLAILRIDLGPVSDSPKAGNKECNDWPLLCKWKAIVANRLSAIKSSFKGRKPCGGMMRKPDLAHMGNIKGAKEPGHEQDGHHGGKHSRPHGHGHGHGHGHHGWHRHHRHRLHRILHAIARVLLTVLVPILIGVAAGMLLYLVGYVVGAALGFVFGRLVGRRPRYQAIALTDDAEQLPRGSMDKFEYRDEEVHAGEAPPEYVEVEGKEVQVEE